MNRHRLLEEQSIAKRESKVLTKTLINRKRKISGIIGVLVIQCNKCTCTNVIVQKAYSNFIFGIADV